MTSQFTPGRQVTEVRSRAFAVDLPAEVLNRIQRGVMSTTYRGIPFLKNPFDVVLYMRLLERLRPKTIIEIGSFRGGSAVWFRDQCEALGLETGVISIDLKPPVNSLNRVTFCAGDAGQPDSTFPHPLIEISPRPWLVVEDSAHTYETTRATLAYFDRLLRIGDYIVVEDGVVADLPADAYGRYEDGPNRAVAQFLNSTGQRYSIDASYCDYFGHNVTYCPNGWLRRDHD